MIRDPRNPDPQFMVPCDSTHEFHKNLRKTLVLLKYHELFIVVEGLGEWPCSIDELKRQSEYYYNEHTCPTNYIGVDMMCENGDTDPHGVFEFVDAVWMTDEYEKGNEEYLMEVFPQMLFNDKDAA